jgi:hypothetical protein
MDSAPDLNSHISLRIVIPQRCVRVVVASHAALVSTLRPLLPNPDAALIFNGTVLHDEHTFAFYRLQSNDSLVAVPPSSAPDTAARWMTITKDYDSFADSINTVLNPELRRESMRLRDRVGWRNELRPHFYRRMERHMKPDDPPGTASGAGHTIIPDPALDVSSDALPVGW